MDVNSEQRVDKPQKKNQLFNEISVIYVDGLAS